MPKKSFRIKPTDSRNNSSLVNPTKLDQNKRLSFNFRYLIETDKFRYQEKENLYFLKLIERLVSACNMNRLELIKNGSKSWRCHQIDWETVTEESFGIHATDICDDAWQFEISSNEHGRVHGFFIEDVFYVRWLDPEHKLYSK